MIPPGKDLLGSTPNARMAFEKGTDAEDRFETTVRSLIDGLHAACREPPAEAG